MTFDSARIRQAVKDNYAEWVLLFGFSWLMVFAWFVPTALPAMMFIWGVPCLVFLGRIKAFWPTAALTAGLLIQGFLWSDFVALMMSGMGIAEAYATSTRYFQAPIFVWFVAWAVICTCHSLTGDRAVRVMNWLGWMITAYAVVQIMESMSGMGLRTAMNNAFYDGLRANMLIVRMGNGNAYLTMLFWPMCLWFLSQRQYVQLGVLILGMLAGAVASDMNAQLIALLVALPVFFAARYWPAALHRFAPHKVMGVMSGLAVVAVPLTVWGLMTSGIAARIRDDLLPSWAARVDIWTFTVARALEKPWLGWGYEASRQYGATIPNHPHNLSLQAWFELGIPGLLMLAGLWCALYWFSGPGDGHAAPVRAAQVRSEGLRELGAPAETEGQPSAHQRAVPYILAAGAGYFVINMVSFGLWRAWYYCLGAVVVGVTILVIRAIDHQIKLRT